MSIRKRTWTAPNGDAREAWVVDYVDGAGKRRLKTFRLKKEADAFAARSKIEVASGIHTPDSIAPTVAEAAATWLAVCEADGLERSTVAQYRQHVDLHIVPMIGTVKLSKLTTPGVHDFHDRLISEGRSPALVRKVTTSLGSIVALAKDRGRFAGSNPVRDMSRRRARKKIEARQAGRLEIGRDIPSAGEVKSILAAVPARSAPLLSVAVFCGLRASELRGLRWDDVDLKRSEIHVRQRADRYGDIGQPKSRAGIRTVPVPPALLRSLKEWRLACPKSALGLVFPTASGKVQHHKNIVRDMLDPAQIAAGVVTPDKKPKYGLHALRHFFASWCINRRVDGGRELPLKAVQALMGHSSIIMTADTYSHLFPRGDDAAELAASERAILDQNGAT